MMAGFRQFFTIFFMEFINIFGQCILGGWWEGHGDGVGGGKSFNKEEIRHK